MATRRAAKKVAPTHTARAPAGAALLPSDIGHLAAQAELDSFLFPHYLLGRQLALEEVVRELLLSVEPTQRAEIVDRLTFNADQAMDRLRDGIPDPTDEVATCGYITTLLQQGM